MQIEKNIAATLQRRMDEAGKTKLEFSRDLGIPRSTLQGYLRGEKGLRSDSIEELAKSLGMSPAQLISGPGAAEAVSPAANAASSLAQHSLVRALAEEIVEAALRRSGEWAGLDAAETGNAPDGAYRYALYEAHGAARVPYAYGILGQQRLDGEWKTVAMIAPCSHDSAAPAHLARLCTGQQLEPIHILAIIATAIYTGARRGEIAGLKEARQIIAASEQPKFYEPGDTASYDAAYARFEKLQ